MTPNPMLQSSRPPARRTIVPGISLANKSQLLFGVSVQAILAVALAVPWVRSDAIVREGQFESARQIADGWLAVRGELPIPLERLLPPLDEDLTSPLRMAVIRMSELQAAESPDPFVAAAAARFAADRGAMEHTEIRELEGHLVYRYARALRAPPVGSGAEASPGAVESVLLIDRTSRTAEGLLLRNRIYIIAAWIVASLGAVLVFYFILTKLILSPVRRLRETTEKVQAGDLTARSQIQTGDEFQQLAEAFNLMLDRVEQSQAQLQSLNESLDLKISEVSEANLGLFESNRLKSEFLASMSHELRTPLNSIIGFAEVLDELAREDDLADPKRRRYISNILTSGRALLEMINDLLEMAKIEAGRMEVTVEPTSISDLVEGLAAIMRMQADSKSIELRADVAANLPLVQTDPGKLQQILFNFLSNAVKFTPVGGTVTIRAERMTRGDGTAGVRLAVTDTGPGIPADQQDAIFEKFRQLDASHTREHAGTGLGLAICRELAELLGAGVAVSSEPGRGATFAVEVPVTYQREQPRPLMA